MDRGVHMIGTSELKGQPKGIGKYQMMGCACNAASREGQGMSYRISKLFSAVYQLSLLFSP